jgi:hypothetical protein
MLVLRRSRPAAADDDDPRMRIVRPARGKDCPPLKVTEVSDTHVKRDNGAAEAVWFREFEVCLQPLHATLHLACSQCSGVLQLAHDDART